jgi:hypothetical protein
MKCAVEMASGGMVCMPSFMKICRGVQTFKGEYTQTHTHTGREKGALISLLVYFEKIE